MAREDWIFFDKRLMAILAVVAIGTGMITIYAWRQWTGFAFLLSCCYFGGCVFMYSPTRTPMQKSISIGVFLGLLVGAAAGFYFFL